MSEFPGGYLEDHAMPCKWLISMVHFHPLTGVKLFPFLSGQFHGGYKWGDPNYGSKSWDDPPSKLHFGK